MKNIVLSSALFVCSFLVLNAAEIQNNVSFGSAQMNCDGKSLSVSTGKVKREWKWTGKGWLTAGIINLNSGKEWSAKKSDLPADWSIPNAETEAELIAVTANESNDEGFTSKHLEVISTIAYPESGMQMQHVVWAYPDAPGLRTQLRLKRGKAKHNSPDKDANQSSGIAEWVPVSLKDVSLEAIGYYSDTQHRNKRETEIIREESQNTEAGKNNWASILSVKQGNDGLLLVKESHKCVNTPNGGANTGGFSWGANGISISGMGWQPKDIDYKRWYPCWANWLVLYRGGEDEQSLALKIWDRIRYPIDPKRDLYIMANTWGSSSDTRNAQLCAREDNVLVEIDSQADLGIDVQQIDDGWQGFKYGNWKPIKENTLTKKQIAYEIYKADTYPVYPEGWKNVREHARKKGVIMGLWAANRILTEDLKWNFDQGDFRYYKIDFANLKTMRDVERLMNKARSLVLHSGHKVRINWDVTEKSPRVGYFFGREYGNIYLENRKPTNPPHVVYIPYLVLRDAWQVSKHLNLNKFQVTVENVDRVDQKISDANRHPHDYCVAQTLMGSPIFFQETHYYSDDARDAIRPLLKIYKEHRKDMFDGYVFPVGEKPDNASWSGFQCVIPKKSRGYLTLFRQLENTEMTKKIKLKFLKPGTEIQLTDLITGEKSSAKLDENRAVTFKVEKAPGFRFMQYRVLK